MIKYVIALPGRGSKFTFLHPASGEASDGVLGQDSLEGAIIYDTAEVAFERLRDLCNWKDDGVVLAVLSRSPWRLR